MTIITFIRSDFMKVIPVKKNNYPKYPTINQVELDQMLLKHKPNKWQKTLIASTLSATIALGIYAPYMTALADAKLPASDKKLPDKTVSYGGEMPPSPNVLTEKQARKILENVLNEYGYKLKVSQKKYKALPVQKYFFEYTDDNKGSTVTTSHYKSKKTNISMVMDYYISKHNGKPKKPIRLEYVSYKFATKHNYSSQKQCAQQLNIAFQKYKKSINKAFYSEPVYLYGNKEDDDKKLAIQKKKYKKQIRQFLNYLKAENII